MTVEYVMDTIISAITRKLNITKQMLIWTFCFLFWYVELVPRIHPYLSVTLCTYSTDADYIVNYTTKSNRTPSSTNSVPESILNQAAHPYTPFPANIVLSRDSAFCVRIAC
jgi:hypothetical protein